jgi:putative heme transporter
VLSWIPRWLRRVFAALMLTVVVWYLVIPQFGSAQAALDAITGVNLWFVVVGGVFVVGAIAAQAELTRSVLPRAERPGFGNMVRIEMATMAVSHTVPGGTAAGTALAYRLLTRSNVSGSASGFALAVRGIGSAVVLNVILWAALVISIPARGFDPRYTTAAVLAVVLLGLVGGLVISLVRAQDRTTRLVCRLLRPLPFVNHERLPELVDRQATQLRELAGNSRLALRAVGWSVAYWLGLAASLWVLLHAFGWTGDPISVLVAFGLVNVLAALPVSPRGLGVLEAVLIPMLVGFGAPAYVATLGVISWRLLSFWAPIPLGTLSYVSIRLSQPDVKADERARIARELGEIGESERETWREWARRRAMRQTG